MIKKYDFSLLQVGFVGFRIGIVSPKNEETPGRSLLGVIFTSYGIGIDFLYLTITIH